MICYKYSDEWFTYYINALTGEKYFELPPNAILIEYKIDDFIR